MAHPPGPIIQPQDTALPAPSGLITPKITPEITTEQLPGTKQEPDIGDAVKVGSNFAGPLTSLGLSTTSDDPGLTSCGGLGVSSPSIVEETAGPSMKRKREEHELRENIAAVTHDADCPVSTQSQTTKRKEVCRCIATLLDYEEVNAIDVDYISQPSSFQRESTEKSLEGWDLSAPIYLNGWNAPSPIPFYTSRTLNIPEPALQLFAARSWFNVSELPPSWPALDATRVPTDPNVNSPDPRFAQAKARFISLESRMIIEIDTRLRGLAELHPDMERYIQDLNRLPTYKENTLDWLALKGSKKLKAIQYFGEIVHRTLGGIEECIRDYENEAEQRRWQRDDAWRPDELKEASDFPLEHAMDAFMKPTHVWQVEFCRLVGNGLLKPMERYWAPVLHYYFGKSANVVAKMSTAQLKEDDMVAKDAEQKGKKKTAKK